MKKLFSNGPTGYSPKIGPWSTSPTGYRYFTSHPFYDIFIWIAFILMIISFGLGIYVGLGLVKTEILEVPKVIKREVKVNNCACAPCQDEPLFNKCEFQSLAYQAISDKFDPITGFKLLSKGEKYYLTGNFYSTEYTTFCSLNKDDKNDYDDQPRYTSNCFYIDQVVNKNLFKPVK